MASRTRPFATLAFASALSAVALMTVPQAASAGSVSVTTPVNVTHDQFADNEESLGMNGSGTLLASAWKDVDLNDGCGFAFSSTGGSTWAPRTFVPGFTKFTNDQNVPGTGSFDVAGDPSVAWNPRFHAFDVVCQAFDVTPPFPIQLLETTFDPVKANPNAGENQSYGASAWTHPVSVATGTSTGTMKGSNGQFPDHESIMVDTSTAAGHHFGRIYVTWAKFNGSGRSPIQVAFSDDNGQHWTGPITVSDKMHKFDQDARINIGPDGTVYDTWISSPTESSLTGNQAMVADSADGGRTWSASTTVAPVLDPTPGLLPNSDYRVFADVTSAVDQATGQLVVVYNDQRSGASNVWVTPCDVGRVDLLLYRPVPGEGQRQRGVLPVDVVSTRRESRPRLLRPELRSGGHAELRHPFVIIRRRVHLDEHPDYHDRLRRRHVPGVPGLRPAVELRRVLPGRLHRGRVHEQQGPDHVHGQRLPGHGRVLRAGRFLGRPFPVTAQAA